MTTVFDLPLIQVDYRVWTNADWNDSFAVFGSEGEPVVLTGVAFYSHVRPYVDSETLTLLLSTQESDGERLRDGEIAVGGDFNNVLNVIVPRSVMETLSPGLYFHDLLAVRDNGAEVDDTKIVVQGTLVVNEGVTR